VKKFKFSLEKVLRHRSLQVELAQKDFLEAQAVQSNEIQKLNTLIQTKDESLQMRSDLVQTSQTWVSSVEQINQFLTGQDLRINQQNQRLLEIEKLVEEKREILRHALTEVKIIEKLREKKLEAHVKSEDKKEQDELDELAVLRFSRNEGLIKGSHEDGI
jgi:flagellar protein FliJ